MDRVSKGALDKKFSLSHKSALHGSYTLFVQVPGKTSWSKPVHF